MNRDTKEPDQFITVKLGNGRVALILDVAGLVRADAESQSVI